MSSFSDEEQTHFGALAQEWSKWKQNQLNTIMVCREAQRLYKHRLSCTVWRILSKEYFSLFLKTVMELSLEAEYSQRKHAMDFVGLCLRSIHVDHVRDSLMQYTSIGIFKNLDPPGRIEYEVNRKPSFLHQWESLDGSELVCLWLSNQVKNLHFIFHSQISIPLGKFVCSFLQVLILLESQLYFRRFVHTLLEDHQIAKLFFQTIKCDDVDLRKMIKNWIKLLQAVFVVQLNDEECLLEEQAIEFQKYLFLNFNLDNLSMVSVSRLRDSEYLFRELSKINFDVLEQLCNHLKFRVTNFDDSKMSRDELVIVFVNQFCTFESPLDFKNTPLFPLGTNSLVDSVLPPLSPQFLSLNDYLFRHGAMFRRESEFTIKSHVDECVGRLRPTWNPDTRETNIDGKCRMSVIIDSCSIVNIGRMAAFDTSPSHVEIEINYSILNLRPDTVSEWDSMSKGEVIYLCIVDCNIAMSDSSPIKCIRGAVVESLVMSDGVSFSAIRNTQQKITMIEGTGRDARVLRVFVDRHQFAQDRHADKIYSSFNVLLRRNKRENNYWAVIEGIHDSYDKDLLPDWLYDTYLGYETIIEYDEKEICFNDTFISTTHIKDTLNVEYSGQCDFLWFNLVENTIIRRPRFVDPFSVILKSEKINFTKRQIEAIKSGAQSGITLIVGPPGTGKTDVAVQILCNLYYGTNSRALLLCHSNHALNHLFQKLNQIPQSKLLRLGHADDEMLGYDQFGRVSHCMSNRESLLMRVDLIAKSMQVIGNYGFSCENAMSFFKVHVRPRWNKYYSMINDEDYLKGFPFKLYVEEYLNIPLKQDLSFINNVWIHIQFLMDEIEQLRPFEVLRKDVEKADLLLAKEAKIIAMTTTYAALKRKELMELGFSFDTFLMEEAGAVLEIETFLALSLSKNVSRVILIGDHNQLPPVVQCPELHDSESLFTRLIKLGLPKIQLDKQGRTRQSICELYSHVYDNLGHLPHVLSMTKCNPGFSFEYQFISVFDETGETQPALHYFQNLGEAEYIVMVFQFMCLIGYPSNSVVILTTYTGQRDLIKEIMQRRCKGSEDLFKKCIITTVDKFQGQQSDIVLLSLVRTRNVGHLADIRRLVVAMSRARLGLYVFGKFNLFKMVFDLKETFDLFNSRPKKLCLVSELYSTNRLLDELPDNVKEIDSIEDLQKLVSEMKLEHDS